MKTPKKHKFSCLYFMECDCPPLNDVSEDLKQLKDLNKKFGYEIEELEDMVLDREHENDCE